MSDPRKVPHDTAGLDRLSRTAYQLGLGYLWKDFESKLPDLFVDDTTQSRVGVATAHKDEIHWVSTPEELFATLGNGVPTLLILNRYNSWSRIDITLEVFGAICNLAGITPFFLHFVVGMGLKFSSKDEDFMSCYSTFISEKKRLVSSLNGTGTHGDSLWGEPFSLLYLDVMTL
ncbi:hypothetical protein F5Y00DRAFT_262229 [Daldinia vernicosa]|uniref:uncharacterized protein n=1 Tax=Daldinia vernicosa TaxID=114800 RepID=UPI002008A1BD|nr:uncharacterized protein F5Y00DRAFT_262229 [Daldinia vernicosa]KAI0848761.1 hypothetical protein F5Y00DRAFT_262229 [Daldinia vernicosa]